MGKRLLLKEAAEELGMTQHYLRTEIKARRIPYLMAGNRYILDVQQVEEYLKCKALENMKPTENVIQIGKLRRIDA